MKKILVSLFALAFIFVSAPAFGADINLAKTSTIESIVKAGKIRVGFESGYLPFEMTNTKGNYMGFDIDLGKALAKAMKVKYEPVNTAWDGIIPALITDKFDVLISGMTCTQERNLAINFTVPYIVVGQAILLNKKHEGKVLSYKDLNDPKFVVCSKLGTTGEQAVKRMIPKATYKSFEVETEACMEVLQGNADATVYDLPLIEFFQAEHGAGKTIALNKPFTFEPLAIAVRKGDPDFLNFLNNFIRQYKNDGRWQRSYDKWIKSNEWTKDMKN
ncbi:transporter substrate-binding domain-containing protein [Desulfospira joergensenii]|uniref:transporter substrate-binding domain-containing protein n=1 Tax=Desulfospira joergensenii TaxID=53329 RepID=UPI0003B581C2|nr:transporter substrate-binding domain-containing protein [Desulfospira joergensenii]